MKGKDLLSISDLSGDDILSFISDTVDIKAKGWLSLLERKTLALIFEKPSLRTRVSFEVAMGGLGGQTIYLSPAEVGLGERESVPDVARVLSRYVDVIAARTFSHETLGIMATYATVPVVNALSDREHPCQALADLLTIYEKKDDLAGLTLAFIGDGNNVANSLLLAAALTGMNFRIASPPGYTVQPEIWQLAEDYAASSGGEIFSAEDPDLAVSGADVVYTDVWTSMGQEAEALERQRVFANYRVDSKLLSLAKDDAILMHPLPAHRGQEVAEGILDSPQSVVFDQAENRMHVQKALLAHLLGGLSRPLAGYH
ncbi:MAG: ornithine carbamoyltransferase [Dehalococcoidales bacterium]|nr:ornithine carbamoyltransferase [Dehalococcoidales bacterium]MDZ4230680.1 ornithine carbamoyltransferase [Dehalococcoidales bacterium]